MERIFEKLPLCAAALADLLDLYEGDGLARVVSLDVV